MHSITIILLDSNSVHFANDVTFFG